MFKWLGIAVVLFITMIIGVGLVLPESSQVSRSIIVQSSVPQVFAKVNNFQEFNRWSPWATIDPNTRYQFSGPQSGIGAKMSWQSNHDQVGSGSQEIIASVENDKVTVRLMFEGQPDASAYYLTKSVEGGTKVTWGFTAHHGYNIFGRYFGLTLDKLIGEDYEKGLKNLKVLVESERGSQPDLEPESEIAEME